MKTSKEILQCAHDLIAHLSDLEDDRGPNWSATNFARLKTFAKSKDPDLSTYFKSGDENSEFIWDFIASSPRTGIFLAAESEQDSHTTAAVERLKHDFEKLLYVYAPIRLLITKAKDPEHAQNLVTTLTSYAKGCTIRFNPGSVFVLHIGLWNNAGNLAYIFQSQGEPAHREEELRFSPV